MSKNAESIFRNIVNGGYAYLQQMKDDKEIETELIDFKRKAGGKAPMDLDDKKNYAKALSAFGNGAGGVIVWGLDCRGTKDSADHVRELIPFTGIKQVQTDLYDLASKLVVPGPSGVVHELVEESAGTDKGFVISYIPEHEGPPVQNIYEEDYRFYYRSGSTFKRMPHWMLADRFMRKPSAELNLEWRLGPWSPEMVLRTVCIDLRNVGKQTAKNITVVVRKDKTPNVVEWKPIATGGFNCHPKTNPERLVVEGQDAFVLHPTMDYWILDLVVDWRFLQTKGLNVYCDVYCDNFASSKELHITSERSGWS